MFLRSYLLTSLLLMTHTKALTPAYKNSMLWAMAMRPSITWQPPTVSITLDYGNTGYKSVLNKSVLIPRIQN